MNSFAYQRYSLSFWRVNILCMNLVPFMTAHEISCRALWQRTLKKLRTLIFFFKVRYISDQINALWIFFKVRYKVTSTFILWSRHLNHVEKIWINDTFWNLISNLLILGWFVNNSKFNLPSPRTGMELGI